MKNDKLKSNSTWYSDDKFECLNVMIGRGYLGSQRGEHTGILRMLINLFSRAQTNNKEKMHMKNTIFGYKKTRKWSTVILKAIPCEECIENKVETAKHDKAKTWQPSKVKSKERLVVWLWYTVCRYIIKIIPKESPPTKKKRIKRKHIENRYLNPAPQH